MKLYAVRDRLIDYFLQPFAGPGDKEVLAAIATRVNNDQDQDAISQAPHHFEVWKLGEVQDDGTLVAQKELICDCSALVRAGRQPANQRPGEVPWPHGQIDRSPQSARSTEASNERPIAHQVESAHELRAPTPGFDRGSN